ncbi:MAG: hypothetical protein ABJO57_01165 [Lentilitoribacter sp.]
MATTTPTKIAFHRKAYFLFLLIFNPQKFDEEEKKDNKILRAQKHDPTKPINRSKIIRLGLLNSFAVFVATVTWGIISGFVISYWMQSDNSKISALLIIIGGGLLLWATFSERGWAIQSFGGVTLGERASKWIFRSLFCLGTWMMTIGAVFSVGWINSSLN